MILGADLSLTAAGFVAMPLDWAGDWGRLQRLHVGHSLPGDATSERLIGRLHQISSAAISFATRHGCSHGIVEDYAFASRTSHAHALGEVGGAVKLALATQAGLVVEAVHAATARKLMLGKLPRKDQKAHVREACLRLGMPMHWTDDEMDAAVVANWLANKMGGGALVWEQAA